MVCYPVCGTVHIKQPLLLIEKSSPCGGSGFPLSLSVFNEAGMFLITVHTSVRCMVKGKSQWSPIGMGIVTFGQQTATVSWTACIKQKDGHFYWTHLIHFVYGYVASEHA